MVEGECIFEFPVGVQLCALSEIPERGARNFVLKLRAGRFHGFVVRYGDLVRGYVDRCAHMGLPLAKILDQYLTPAGDLIACDWHGALFRIENATALVAPASARA